MAHRQRPARIEEKIDSGVAELVRRKLPPDRGARIRIRTGDAREVLTRAPDGVF